MPWKELSVSEQRLAMVHRVVTLGYPVARAGREFGVSRKTVHKWLGRYRTCEPFALYDRPRRPAHSPGRTAAAVEGAVLDVRAAHGWGPRKIHRTLLDRGVAGVPSVRTVAAILARRGCVPPPPPADDDDDDDGCGSGGRTPHPFERGRPNELWQLDHKGAVEVARRRVCPLSVIDDHSRYCLCFARVDDLTARTTWDVLWGLFERFGLPDALLCDNAFSAPVGLSWFDARLVRLDVEPAHGRPRHPQTQGKVERFNGTAARELIGFDARRDTLEHFDADCERFRVKYNTLRPHEALGDVPPVARWRPSARPRPPRLPDVTYPAGAVTRRVSDAGDVRYRNARVVVGRGLAHETVMVEERERDVAVYYAWKLVRVIPQALLGGPRSDKMV
jgi:transposase InsO family protein